MAMSKCYYPPARHRFFSCDQNKPTGSEFELDEFDLYNHGLIGSESAGSFSISNLTNIFSPTGDDQNRSGRPSPENLLRITPPSLPVNVPDWSKILREENGGSRRWFDGPGEDSDGDEFSIGEGRRVPPHELLARRRIASFSVHEGAGRTLKGRDLSRVRNAIFEIMGFED